MRQNEPRAVPMKTITELGKLRNMKALKFIKNSLPDFQRQAESRWIHCSGFFFSSVEAKFRSSQSMRYHPLNPVFQETNLLMEPGGIW